MGYTTVTTQKATYHIVQAAHVLTTKDEVISKDRFRSLDALVLESGAIGQQNLNAILGHSQYAWIVEQIQEAREDKTVSLFLPDINISPFNQLWEAPVIIGKGLAFSRLLGRAIGRRIFWPWVGLTMAACFAPTVYKGKLPDWLPYAQALLETPWMWPTATARSIATAKKLEDYISPRLQLKSSHPEIAIVYGGGHSDIHLYLQHPDFLEWALWLYGPILKRGNTQERDYTTEVLFTKDKRLVTKLFTPVFT